jgi:hypothetical protein
MDKNYQSIVIVNRTSAEPVYGGGDSNALVVQIDPMLWDLEGRAAFSGIRVSVYAFVTCILL